MRANDFLKALGSDFFTGVPDSLLRPFCDAVMNTYGLDPEHHIIAANEGNCAALAAGYHLATAKTGVVYLQNSGEGNILNPLASLLNREVYGIPVIFVIGWRGQPGVHDEPQHIFQGKVTFDLLRTADVETFRVDSATAADEVADILAGRFGERLRAGGQVAFVVEKGALRGEKIPYRNENTLTREDAISGILKVSGSDVLVSTTGKASRELFELRAARGEGHERDFLTVGSMGHSSSIALGIALQKPGRRVWCIDGDGAALMHMGAMAVIGNTAPRNLIHVVINNFAHESVGGAPTVARTADLTAAARACGYPWARCVKDAKELSEALAEAKAQEALCFLEVRCAVGARENLGRPTTAPGANKEAFMACLQNDL